MANEQDRPKDDEQVEELRESAETMGVEDVEEKDPDQIVDEVRHGKADSETSPSGWHADRDEDGPSDGDAADRAGEKAE
ncbi:hypothetical protein BH23ACT9_BH23ACT9_31240 [soil metagenome]